MLGFKKPMSFKSADWGSTDVIVNRNCYRTLSHFGFRISTQLMVLQHFHLPAHRLQSIPIYPFRMYHSSEMIQQYESFNFNNQNVIYDEPIPSIKCSLCSTSRRSKRKLDFTHEKFSTFNDGRSIIELNSSNLSEMSSFDSSSDQFYIDSNKNFAVKSKRITVKVFTVTKENCSMISRAISRN